MLYGVYLCCVLCSVVPVLSQIQQVSSCVFIKSRTHRQYVNEKHLAKSIFIIENENLQ